MFDVADLPDDIAALKAMLMAATEREAETVAQIARKDERIERLEKLVAAFRQLLDASPRRPILTSSTWRWKTWKRPWALSMPRMRRTLLQETRLPGHAR